MRKLFVMIAVMGFAAGTITSCGSKKEEAKKEDAEDYADNEKPEEKKASADDLIAQGKVLTEQSDCKTCHHLTNKIVGPAHADVAKKYEFTTANVNMLAGKIISGGSGNWGDVPMTAHPDISKADAEKMAMYVLSLDGEKPKD
jgi:cytochrome c